MSQRVIAVIQARMGGDRLPGKVLLPLGGKPMLRNVIERVQRANLIDEIIVVVPWGDLSKLAFIGHQTHVTFVEFSTIPDSDIIGRYCRAANNADFVVRISADNPCVEANEINQLIIEGRTLCGSKYLCHKFLVMNSEHFERNHDGFGGEILTADTWRWLDGLIQRNSTYYRERPELFWREIDCFVYMGRHFPNGFRLDVNTQADYEKLKAIYDHFGHNHFTVDEVIEFLNGTHGMEERPISS